MSTGRATPLVTVLVPTHDHACTLDLAVNSVLEQTVDAIDVVVIGDGVGDDTRDVVSSLMTDARVKFLDHPKTASRAESVRHEVLSEARSPYIAYMGDDDLMLADHLESTLDRLQTVDFTHPFPAFIERDGSVGFHLTDISDARCVAWHLMPGRNAISLTGVGHRLDAYLTLPDGWREPPSGVWSDLYMWQQWFKVPTMRFSTGDRVSILKFPESMREEMTGPERRSELTIWLEKSRAPDFATTLHTEVETALRRRALNLMFDLESSQGELADALSSVDVLGRELKVVRELAEAHASDAEVSAAEARAHAAEARAHAAEARTYAAAAEEARARADELQGALSAVRSTRTWRLHDRLARFRIVRKLASR